MLVQLLLLIQFLSDEPFQSLCVSWPKELEVDPHIGDDIKLVVEETDVLGAGGEVRRVCSKRIDVRVGQRQHELVLHVTDVRLPLQPRRFVHNLLLRSINCNILPQILARSHNIIKRILRLCLNSQRIKISTLQRVSHFPLQHFLKSRRQLKLKLYRQILIQYDPDDLNINGIHLLVLIDMRVETQHVEVDIDGLGVVWLEQIEVDFNLLSLTLTLILYEKVRLPINKLQRIFKLALLLQNRKIQKHKLFVILEILLLNDFEHQQICDI